MPILDLVHGIYGQKERDAMLAEKVLAVLGISMFIGLPLIVALTHLGL